MLWSCPASLGTPRFIFIIKHDHFNVLNALHTLLHDGTSSSCQSRLLDALHLPPSTCHTRTCTNLTQTSTTCTAQHHCTGFPMECHDVMTPRRPCPSIPCHGQRDTLQCHQGSLRRSEILTLAQGHVAMVRGSLRGVANPWHDYSTHLTPLSHFHTPFSHQNQSHTRICSLLSTALYFSRFWARLQAVPPLPSSLLGIVRTETHVCW